jgi:hypothetical protein
MKNKNRTLKSAVFIFSSGTKGKVIALNAKHEVLFEQDELRRETISKILVFLNDE